MLGKFYRNYQRILMVRKFARASNNQIADFGCLQFSFFFMTLGFGLMIMLDARSNIPEQVFYPLIAAAGLGPGFRE